MDTISCVRGTHDILSPEAEKWVWLENKIRDVYLRFQFNEIRTPIFEWTELFCRSIGEGTDIVNKEMYTFENRKGKNITLRPEGTASVVRSCIQHKLASQNQLNKLFYFGPMFRYEKPQAGRQRQFHQTGVELIGSDSPISDIETINLLKELLFDLGLNDLKFRVNSTGSLENRPKLIESVRSWLSDDITSMCSDCKTRFEKNVLRVYDCKVPSCRSIIDKLPGIDGLLESEDKEFFNTVLKGLDSLNIPYEVSPQLVRGLDYYTHTIFEIYSSELGACDAIAGGGRYDNLFTELGSSQKVPSVGFAIGMERLFALLQKKSLFPESGRPDIFIINPTLENALGNMSWIQNLRREGFKVTLDLLNRGMKAQFRSLKNILPRFVLIRGDEEIQKDIVKVKNYDTKEEIEVPFKGVISFLQKSI